MAMEFKKKGANMLLGPVVSPLGRVVEGGRNWEGESPPKTILRPSKLTRAGFTPDPYLAGSLTSSTVNGTQSSGVIASTKVSLEVVAFWPERIYSPRSNRSTSSAMSKRRTEIQVVISLVTHPISTMPPGMNSTYGE